MNDALSTPTERPVASAADDQFSLPQSGAVHLSRALHSFCSGNEGDHFIGRTVTSATTKLLADHIEASDFSDQQARTKI
jgi:hypothetical protein